MASAENAARKSEKIFVISFEQEKKFKTLFPFAADKVQLVRNGCDTNIFYKEENKYRLEFILNSKEMSYHIDIRFRNSGSRYQPFNRVFMDLYMALQEYDSRIEQKNYVKNNNKK